METRRRLRAVLVFLILFYQWAFVWPTPYFYTKIGVIPIRVNRVTGHADYLSLQGWQPELPQVGEEPNTFRPKSPASELRVQGQTSSVEVIYGRP